jgi:AcrR family transcriptional regulator
VAAPVGRPRDEAIDAAVLVAARDLLAEHGYRAVTIEAVARRAGVGRPTVYRRWANKVELVFDALFEETETVPVPDHGDPIADMLELAKVFGSDLASPAAAQALVAVMAEVGSDSAIATKVRDGVIRPRAAEFAVVVERAQRQGVIRPDVDPVTVVHAIAGALYYHAAVLGEHPTDDLVAAVFDLFAHGVLAPGAPEPGRRAAVPSGER